MNYLDTFAPTDPNLGASTPVQPAAPAPPQNAFLDYLSKLNTSQGPGAAGQGSSQPGSRFQPAPTQKGNSALQGAALKGMAGGGMAGIASL